MLNFIGKREKSSLFFGRTVFLDFWDISRYTPRCGQGNGKYFRRLKRAYRAR
jgi:hypothetical protein